MTETLYRQGRKFFLLSEGERHYIPIDLAEKWIAQGSVQVKDWGLG